MNSVFIHTWLQRPEIHTLFLVSDWIVRALQSQHRGRKWALQVRNLGNSIPGWHTMARLQCAVSWMGMRRKSCAKTSTFLVHLHTFLYMSSVTCAAHGLTLHAKLHGQSRGESSRGIDPRPQFTRGNMYRRRDVNSTTQTVKQCTTRLTNTSSHCARAHEIWPVGELAA